MEKSATPSGEVKLKPFLSMRPGQYLALLYGAVLVGVLFVLFMLPGLRAQAGVYRFTSEPSGAAVRVDDVYWGQTPCTLIIPRGARNVDVVCAGFEPAALKLEVRARLFLRRPFMRPLKIHTALTESAPLAALTAGAREYAQWSFAGEPSTAYQLPPALSEGARLSASRSNFDAASQKTADDLLLSAARFTASRFALKELIRAGFYLHARGAAPSLGSLSATLAAGAALLAAEPRLSVIAASYLPDDASALFLESPLYPKEVIDFNGEDMPVRPEGVRRAAAFGEAIVVNGLTFVKVEGGAFMQAANFPHTQEIKPFYLAVNELSAHSWAEFTTANPEWAASNAGALSEQGLAGNGYLQTSAAQQGNPFAVAGISCHAAEAYCAWLSERLPPVLAAAGWVVRLPTEAEWEYTAKAVMEIWQTEFTRRGGAQGALAYFEQRGLPANMITLTADSANTLANAGLWEWCANDYTPQNFFPVPAEAARAIPSPERSVRGGSWINQAFSVTPETRASLPPALCSPFVSARPVIALKSSY